MKVSVLVPVYGVEGFIERCATSLMEQTHEDVEYIFVDDATPDASMRVLERVLAQYPHRRAQVRMLTHEQNGGLAQARITALHAATGEAVMVVDSDDSLPREAIATLCATMERTGCDIVDGAYEMERDGTTIALKHPFAGNLRRYLRTMLCHDLVDNNVWGRLIKKDLFDRHHIMWTPGVNNGEDYSVVPRLLDCASGRATTSQVVYRYRTDNMSSISNSMTQSHFESWLRACAIVRDHFDGKADYATALRLGIIGEMRRARRYGYPVALVDELCGVEVKGAVLRALNCCVRSRRVPFWLANALYKAVRRIYCSLLA